MTNPEIEQLRQISIARILGLAEGRKHMIKCEFHSDDKPSLSISPKNLYNCFGCGEKGAGAIDFAMAKQKVDFTTACEQLREYL